MTHQGVIASRRTTIGLVVLCALILWAILPVFMEGPDWILVLTVNSSTNDNCPAGSACFTLELRNRGLWPISIEIAELQFYPSLTGPGLSVKWVGPSPEKSLVLMPFTGNTYTFSLGLLGGLGGPDRIYAIMRANVVVLYVSRHVVVHSGKR